jgi:hypothetical protein
LLLATADDRTFFLIGDGQQMFKTAFSISKLGEIGFARSQDNPGFERTEGDSVSRYGMGFSLVLLLPLLLAHAVEAKFGPGASQTLLTATQCLLTLAAGLFAARLARQLGADRTGERLTLFAAIFATPLWTYASGDFSEALQAAALAAAAALALEPPSPNAGEDSWRLRLAGFAGGTTVLTKSFLLPAATVLLLPPLFPRVGRGRRAFNLLLGLAIPIAAWGAFEWTRFGRLFGGYGAEGFTNPFWDGFWRLTVGVNKGLFVYAPLTVLALPVLLSRIFRRDSASQAWIRLQALSISAAVLAIALPVSKWWAWDGVTGWGPRLLLPAIPLLVAAAVARRRRFPTALLGALVAAGILLNALGVFQTAPTISAYLTDVPTAVVPAGSVPPGPNIVAAGPGRISVSPYILAARIAVLSPIRLHAYFLRTRLLGGNVKEKLSSPPWKMAHPELVPSFLPISDSEPVYRSMFDGFRWPFCGDAMFGRRPRRDLPTAYIEALRDQVYRAFDQNKVSRALSLAGELVRLSPGPLSAALYADALRANERRDEERAYLQRLPEDVFRTPEVGMATALLALQEGRIEDARGAVREFVVPAIPSATTLLTAAPDDWPEDVRDFIAPVGP